MIIIFSIISIALSLLVFSKKISPLLKDSSIVGTIVSTAVLGRISMFSIPNIQPVTFLVIVAGYIYGSGVGFLAGALTAIISNFALGQGPWTLWQAVAWGLVGASGGLLKLIIKEPKKSVLVTVAILWGYLFGAIMDSFGWLVFMPVHTFSTYLAMFASSFVFNTLHALGNGLFMFALGVPLMTGIETIRCGIYGLNPNYNTQKIGD